MSAMEPCPICRDPLCVAEACAARTMELLELLQPRDPDRERARERKFWDLVDTSADAVLRSWKE
jgi:hypothetical protein